MTTSPNETPQSPPTDAVAFVIGIQSEAAKTGTLTMWTVYDRPRDFPENFVARCFDINPDGAAATPHVIVAKSLRHIRRTLLRAGLVMLTRSPEDDRKIVETWL
jgi:hypothetical protein